jgi:enoyl-CoA hydratase/carnithine racemase
MALEQTRDGDVVIVSWNDGENRYRGDSVAEWHEVLDEVEATDGPLALVVTGTGKFFSNGLDLDWMSAHPDESGDMLRGVHRLLGRMLVMNLYTVGAINGHAFAGGAMLTCGFDERIMREDRGYWCLPEVDLGLPLTPGMYATVAARLPQATLHESIVTGRRYGGAEALVAGIVEHIAAESDVLPLAVERAQAMAAKNRSIIANHKRQMYGAAAELCGA